TVEPDIDLAPVQAADQVRRCGGKAEKLPGVPLASISPDRGVLAQVYGDRGSVPVLLPVVRESEGVEESRGAAWAGVRISPFLLGVATQGVRVGHPPPEAQVGLLVS